MQSSKDLRKININSAGDRGHFKKRKQINKNITKRLKSSLFKIGSLLSSRSERETRCTLRWGAGSRSRLSDGCHWNANYCPLRWAHRVAIARRRKWRSLATATTLNRTLSLTASNSLIALNRFPEQSTRLKLQRLLKLLCWALLFPLLLFVRPAAPLRFSGKPRVRSEERTPPGKPDSRPPFELYLELSFSLPRPKPPELRPDCERFSSTFIRWLSK